MIGRGGEEEVGLLLTVGVLVGRGGSEIGLVGEKPRGSGESRL
jgi:hypothetical protein